VTKNKAILSRWGLIGLSLMIAGCGEPLFENAGSPNSLPDDRKACAGELEQSPAARAFRQNSTAYPDYASQLFTEMDRCIERKGWKQVRSQPELARQAPPSQLAQTSQPAPRSDPKVGNNNTAGDEWPEDDDGKK
jgi:hypothetical protein